MADEIDRQVADKVNGYIARIYSATRKDGLVLIERAFQSIRDDRHAR